MPARNVYCIGSRGWNRLEGYSFPQIADRLGIVPEQEGGTERVEMDAVNDKRVKDLSRTARAEASAWIVRLHGPHRTPRQGRKRRCAIKWSSE
jgi:hypothetical protein